MIETQDLCRQVGVDPSLRARCEEAEALNERMLNAIKLHLRHHEHGCSYLGEFVDYTEIYK